MTEAVVTLARLLQERGNPSATRMEAIAPQSLRGQAEAFEREHAIAVPHQHGHHAARPPHSRAASDHTLRLLAAMVAAAKADGRLDEQERERILDRAAHAEVSGAVRDFLQCELRGPIDLDAIAGGARSRLEAIELYLVSLTAIEVTTEAERRHLAGLAQRLGLEAALVSAIHAKHGAPAPQPA